MTRRVSDNLPNTFKLVNPKCCEVTYLIPSDRDPWIALLQRQRGAHQGVQRGPLPAAHLLPARSHPGVRYEVCTVFVKTLSLLAHYSIVLHSVNELFFEKYPDAVLSHQVQVMPFNADKTKNMRSLNPEGE